MLRVRINDRILLNSVETQITLLYDKINSLNRLKDAFSKNEFYKSRMLIRCLQDFKRLIKNKKCFEPDFERTQENDLIISYLLKSDLHKEAKKALLKIR